MEGLLRKRRSFTLGPFYERSREQDDIASIHRTLRPHLLPETAPDGHARALWLLLVTIPAACDTSLSTWVSAWKFP